MQHLLLASLPALVLNAHDFNARVRAAQNEARTKMMSSRNLLSPASGEPVVNPTKDMVLGCYYLTSEKESDTGYPPFVPMRLRYLKPLAGTSHTRFVADCIAGLSEAEAVALHGRLTGTNAGSVLDPIVR